MDLIVDFVERRVRTYDDEKVRYEWRTQRAYLEQLVHEHEIDWVNSLFLSCRFSAKRIGPYNEFVYTFFKCLSDERLNYAEGWYEEQDAAVAAETIRLDGWEVQRRCPRRQGHPGGEDRRAGARRRAGAAPGRGHAGRTRPARRRGRLSSACRHPAASAARWCTPDRKFHTSA